MSIRHFFFALMALSLSALGLAQTPLPAPPKFNSKGYLLLDMHSGRALAENNADESLEPASITKLMSAYVVFDALKQQRIALTDLVPVSAKAWKMQGSRMFIEVDTEVSVDELIQGMIVQSGNDATVALAEHVAGSEEAFVGLMNQTAERLNLNDTHYMNASGLPHAKHMTTGHDIAELALRLIRDFPEYYHWYSQKSFTYNEIQQYNRNKLLWKDERVDGMKTGRTESAGFCLVSSAQRDHMRLIAVVLGAPSDKVRVSGSKALLDYGFRHFETYRLYQAGETITQAPLFKGQTNEVQLGLTEDLFVTLQPSEYDQLQASMDMQQHLIAPLNVEQSVGTVRIRLADRLLAERDLYPLAAAPLGGLFKRAKDEVKLWFK